MSLFRNLPKILDRLAETIKANSTFFIAYNLLLLIGLYPLLAWDKLTIFLFINKHHHPFLDQFFFYLTHLGSGITYGLLMLCLFLLKVPYRKLLIGVTTFGVMSVIIQVLKRLIFSHHVRPIKFIELAEEAVHLHLVDNVEVLTHLSFPSGHAGTIFAAVAFLSLFGIRDPDEIFLSAAQKCFNKMLKNAESQTPGRVYQLPVTYLLLVFIQVKLLNLCYRLQHVFHLLLLLIAFLVAYSRIYLCQHFYTDIYVGALIGGWTAFLVNALLVDWRMPNWLATRFP